jgi:hypothetical protein
MVLKPLCKESCSLWGNLAVATSSSDCQRSATIQVTPLFPAMSNDTMWTALEAAPIPPLRATELTATSRAAAEAACESVLQYLRHADARVADRQRLVHEKARRVADVVSSQLYTCELCAPKHALPQCLKTPEVYSWLLHCHGMQQVNHVFVVWETDPEIRTNK